MLRVSELIKELHDVLEDHGDVGVKIVNNEGEAGGNRRYGVFSGHSPC